MRFNLETNAEQLGRAMTAFFNDQIAFAISRAVRQTGLDVQEVQREEQQNAFNIRRKRFMRRAIKIRDWPTKQNPTAIVRIEPPGGAATKAMLIEHEEGGLRRPAPGHRARSVEREVRPAPHRIAPKKLRPKALGLRKVSSGGPAGFEVFHGKHRTFMIRRPGGGGAILQRTSRGKVGTFQGTRLLWALTPEGVELEASLGFHQRAARTVGDRWAENMAQAWDQAIRTAR